MGGKGWKCCGEGVGAPHVLGKHRSSALGISLQIKDERNTGCGVKQNIWEQKCVWYKGDYKDDSFKNELKMKRYIKIMKDFKPKKFSPSAENICAQVQKYPFFQEKISQILNFNLARNSKLFQSKLKVTLSYELHFPWQIFVISS